jgi:hypothetical protein
MFYFVCAMQPVIKKKEKLSFKAVTSDSTSAAALMSEKEVILCQSGNNYL